MTESKETGLMNIKTANNIYGYYNFLTDDKYQEALDVFFYKGASYKNKILLSLIHTTSYEISYVQTKYDESKPTYEIIFKATDPEQMSGNLYLGYKISSADEIIYMNIEYILDFAGGTNNSFTNITVDENYINLISSEFINDRSFKLTFKVLQNFTEGTVFKLNTQPGYIWGLEQNKLQPNGTFRSIPPVMDCSDYVSFLWMVVNTGQIIKNKIFDCQSLLDNRFENIKFIEKIYSNNFYLKYNNYKTLLENLESGDILIFEQSSNYHCIIITDPKKENYAECSGYLEINQGSYYNGKLNPYPLELRFNFLKTDCNIYLCRLYKSI